MILFGHPTGNPNSHQAALSHFERGRLEALVVPWMPSTEILRLLSAVPPLRGGAARLARRRFEPLAAAPKIQGRLAEFLRLLTRARGRGDEGLSYAANDWLMQTMVTACQRSTVSAVHSYEDCSLKQFEEAKRLGKACIYDMPIGYYPYWEKTQADLVGRFADWLPEGGLPSSRWVRPAQKHREMELADLVLVPSSFVRRTIEAFVDRRVSMAPYGVDTEFWKPGSSRDLNRPLRFIYAGQCSIRKGIPLLMEAWSNAALVDAELHLVGSWQLALGKRAGLPSGVRYRGHLSSEALRECFQSGDVFVFPSYFEGFGLVVLEAMACGLPIISSDATAAVDVVDDSNGRVFPAGDVDALTEYLRFFASNRDRLPRMAGAARSSAELQTWVKYRCALGEACGPFC